MGPKENLARATRDNIDEDARALGHVLVWELAPHSNLPGHAYYFIGTCTNCAGNAHAGATWTSATSVIDVRVHPCPGEGTAILTRIEESRRSELFREAAERFIEEIKVATE